jgi:hypothetical protein
MEDFLCVNPYQYDFVSILTNMTLYQSLPIWLCVTPYQYDFVSILTLKDRQHNGQEGQSTQWPRRTDNTMAKGKTNNDLQNITHKAKDWVTRTPLKTGGELRFSGRVSSSCSISDTLMNEERTKLKSSLQKFYGRHHDLVNLCGTSVSQMTTDMFRLS